MTQFEALFGIKSPQIKKCCVLLPFLPKVILREFKIRNFKRGRLYGAGSNDYLTIIHTGVGAGFVGDTVLYLKETVCQNIILFGSCGLWNQSNKLSIGSLVSPLKCYSNESFSQMLLEKQIKAKYFCPNRELFEGLIKIKLNAGIKEVVCCTVSSLKLEEGLADYCVGEGIDVVDMECSAFFAAAAYAGLRAAALFFATDIINKKPFYTELGFSLKLQLYFSIKNAVSLLCELAKKNLNA